MTILDQFKADTSKEHPVYQASLFNMQAPQQATGEVILSSAYRGLVLGIPESQVDPAKLSFLAGELAAHQGNEPTWNALLSRREGLASPLPLRQGIPQVMPLVPNLAYYSTVIGANPGRRWTPFRLLVQLIGAARGEEGGKDLVTVFSQALQVTHDDDIFARLLEVSLAKILKKDPPTPETVHNDDTRAFRGENKDWACPSERFCKDLESVITLKGKLTRRQWIILVEAVLRLGMAMHIMWLCHVHYRFWELVLDAASGTVATTEEIEKSLWQSHRSTHPLMEIGESNGVLATQKCIEKYVYGRFGLNLLLFRLDEAGYTQYDRVLGYSADRGQFAPGALHEFLEYIRDNRLGIDAEPANWLRMNNAELADNNIQRVRCKTGFSKNMQEFLRYSLGQVQTRDEEQKSYDQAYLITKVGQRYNSPWPAYPGPSMLVMLVYACCKDHGDLPTSLEDFRAHLADYGLYVPTGELSEGRVGADLKKQGLVIDSPDAAGGRLLVSPF